MLNEERVSLMTRMASFEEGEGKKSVDIGNYFRSDYIGVQILKSFIYGTIAFLIIFALFIVYDFESFMQDLYKIDLIAFAKNVLTYYLVFIIGYGILTYAIATYRYVRAKKNLKRYYQNLKKLNSLYGNVKTTKKRKAGGRR